MRISIVLPTYNRADIISRAIESITAQPYENWELIIVDDGSEDDTRGVIDSYCRSDERIKCIGLPANRGFFAARNIGVAAASGDWISFLDSDDEFLPDGLSIIADNLIRVDKEIGLVYFSMILRDKNANTRRIGYRRNESWQEYRPSYEEIVLKKRFNFDMHRCVKTEIAKENPFSEDNPGLETVHYASLAKKGHQFKYVNQVVVRVNQDQDNRHSTIRMKKWPLELARTYIGFVKDYSDVLQNTEELFDYYVLIVKCYYYKRDLRLLYWLAKSFMENPGLFLRISAKRVRNAFRFQH